MRIVLPTGSSGPKSSVRTVSPMRQTRSCAASMACDQISPREGAHSRITKKSRVVPTTPVAALVPGPDTCCGLVSIDAARSISGTSTGSAVASPSSSSDGLSSSRTPLLDEGRGRTMRAFVPRVSIAPETTVPAPSASATTMVTAAMPTRMPKAVSAERAGRWRIAENASRHAVATKPSALLMAQGLHGLDVGGTPGRQEAEDEADQEARPDRERDGSGAEPHGPAEPDMRRRHQSRGERPAERWEGNGFYEKLQLDVARTRRERRSYATFATPFEGGDQHDVD